MSALTALACPACGTPRRPRQYVCGPCWYRLARWVRVALCRRDGLALERVRDLHAQIDAGIPIELIEVRP